MPLVEPIKSVRKHSGTVCQNDGSEVLGIYVVQLVGKKLKVRSHVPNCPIRSQRWKKVLKTGKVR